MGSLARDHSGNPWIVDVTVDRGTQATRAPTARVTEASYLGYSVQSLPGVRVGRNDCVDRGTQSTQEKRQGYCIEESMQYRAQLLELTFLTFTVTILVRLFDCKHFIEGKRSTRPTRFHRTTTASLASFIRLTVAVTF